MINNAIRTHREKAEDIFVSTALFSFLAAPLLLLTIAAGISFL
jgi:hypothetical protein